MRSVEITLYSITELSQSARMKAISYYRLHFQDLSHIHHEAFESVKAFRDCFDIKFKRFSFEEPFHNDFSCSISPDVLRLSGPRLSAYIWNNYKHFLFLRKMYSKSYFKKGEDNITYLKRYSNIALDDSGTLTGTVYDNILLQPIYDHFKNPEDNFYQLIAKCFNEICKNVNEEYEACSQDAFILDEIAANDYEFYADGSFYFASASHMKAS